MIYWEYVSTATPAPRPMTEMPIQIVCTRGRTLIYDSRIGCPHCAGEVEVFEPEEAGA